MRQPPAFEGRMIVREEESSIYFFTAEAMILVAAHLMIGPMVGSPARAGFAFFLEGFATGQQPNWQILGYLLFNLSLR